MNLTPFERSVLVNQYKLLKVADPESVDEYDQNIAILYRGYAGQYDQAPAITSDPEVSEADCAFVMDVLDMFSLLQQSARQIGLSTKEVNFPGFDGNNESALRSYALFLHDDQHRWQEVSS